MKNADPYEILGLPRNASHDAVKAAYRAAARSCHPDTHPNDLDATGRFKAVAWAYEVLSDPVRRAHYDETGDPDGPVNIKEEQYKEALGVLQLELEHALVFMHQKGERFAETANMLDLIIEALKRREKDVIDEKQQAINHIRRCKRFSKKFKSKDGAPNILAKIALVPIESLTAKIKQLNLQKQVYRTAIKLARTHSYDCGVKPAEWPDGPQIDFSHILGSGGIEA